jgi:hypothetical protein
MTARLDVERVLDAFLAPDADQLPDRVIEASLADVARTPQRRALRVPWRFRPINTMTRLAIAAAVAVVAVGGALYLLAPPSNVGVPDASPTTAPTTAPPSPGATAVDTSGWTPFTSMRLGISTKFPAGWRVTAATESWIWQSADPGPTDAATDRAVGPENQAFVISSQRLPNGMTEDAWWADYLSADTTGTSPGCFPAKRADYGAVVVAGYPGFLHGGLPACNFTEVVVVVEGRAYQLSAFANVSAPTGGLFDRVLFDAWLTTVTFDPTAADDQPVRPPASAG